MASARSDRADAASSSASRSRMEAAWRRWLRVMSPLQNHDAIRAGSTGTIGGTCRHCPAPTVPVAAGRISIAIGMSSSATTTTAHTGPAGTRKRQSVGIAVGGDRAVRCKSRHASGAPCTAPRTCRVILCCGHCCAARAARQIQLATGCGAAGFRGQPIDVAALAATPDQRVKAAAAVAADRSTSPSPALTCFSPAVAAAPSAEMRIFNSGDGMPYSLSSLP